MYRGLGFGAGFSLFILFIAVLIVWTIVIKGMALWKAARNGHKGWFIAIMIINTVGILELIYILAVAKPAAPVAKPGTPNLG